MANKANKEMAKERRKAEREEMEKKRLIRTALVVCGIVAVVVIAVVITVMDTNKQNAEQAASTSETSDTTESSGSSDLSSVIAGAVQESEPELNTTAGTVCEEGDTVAIDYVGKKDGVAFDGGTGSYDLTLGSGQFIPGFEEGLIGHKVGETVDLDLTFPEEYHSEELAGADVVFTVTINGVYK